MRALLSFCNEQRSPDKGVLLFDMSTKSGTWLAVGTDREIMGTRGLCIEGATLYVLYTIGWHETHLSIFSLNDSMPVLQADVQLPEVKDPHSLCVYEQQLLLASTGVDTLLAYHLNDLHEPSGAPRLLWQASDESVDTHHINSVAVVGDHIYISAFGPRPGEFWSSATDGYIYDVTASQKVRSGLHHPHSLRCNGNDLYFTESARQSLHSLGGASVVIGGYARGCDIAPDGTVIVGSNVARRVSASKGVVIDRNPLENQEGEPMGKCCLVSVTPGRVAKREYHDVSTFGQEIYDISFLPPAK